MYSMSSKSAPAGSPLNLRLFLDPGVSPAVERLDPNRRIDLESVGFSDGDPHREGPA